MTRLANQGISAILNGLDGSNATNFIGFVNAYTADPTTGGANEYAGSTPQAVSWNASSAGSAKTNSSSVTLTTSGATAVPYLGLKSSVSTGTGNYTEGVALSSSVTAVTITVAAGAISIAGS